MHAARWVVRGRWRAAAAQQKQQEQQEQQKQQKQKAKVVPQNGPELPRGQPIGSGGDRRAVARGGQDAQLLLLRAVAAAAAVETSAGRSDALDKAARWRDLSALLHKRAKTARRAVGRRKEQQLLQLQPRDVVTRGKLNNARRGERPSNWSAGELRLLLEAVRKYGRDWAAVASSVGSKTRQQCRHKVDKEVAAGRMQEPGDKQVQDSWSKVELGALKRAVALHGRNWAAVASSVGSKTRQQCKHKVANEVMAGRMQEPGGKQKSPGLVEQGQAGRAQSSRAGPGGKQVQDSWSKVELGALNRAVDQHGCSWVAVSLDPVLAARHELSALQAPEPSRRRGAGVLSTPRTTQALAPWSLSCPARLRRARLNPCPLGESN